MGDTHFQERLTPCTLAAPPPLWARNERLTTAHVTTGRKATSARLSDFLRQVHQVCDFRRDGFAV